MASKGQTDWKRLAAQSEEEIERLARQDSDTIVLRDDELADLGARRGAERASYAIYRDKAGAFRWRLVHPSGRIIAEGGEAFETSEHAEAAIARLRNAILGARLAAA